MLFLSVVQRPHLVPKKRWTVFKWINIKIALCAQAQEDWMTTKGEDEEDAEEEEEIGGHMW